MLASPSLRQWWLVLSPPSMVQDRKVLEVTFQMTSLPESLTPDVTSAWFWNLFHGNKKLLERITACICFEITLSKYCRDSGVVGILHCAMKNTFQTAAHCFINLKLFPVKLRCTPSCKVKSLNVRWVFHCLISAKKILSPNLLNFFYFLLQSKNL